MSALVGFVSMVSINWPSVAALMPRTSTDRRAVIPSALFGTLVVLITTFLCVAFFSTLVFTDSLHTRQCIDEHYA